MQDDPHRSAGKTPAAEGRAQLRDARLEPMEGANCVRGEIWIRRNGYPVFVPYAGPPFNQEHFDAEALKNILDGK